MKLAQAFKDGRLDFLSIALLAPALIAGCFRADFIGFDDRVHYEHELAQESMPLSSLFNATDNSTYFPITILSYRVDRWIFKQLVLPLQQAGAKWSAAPVVRLDSLLLHILAGIFLWRALLALGLGRWTSLFVAAGWAAHPAACESVAWISERKNVLTAFFGFASLWAWFSPNLKTLPRLSLTGLLFCAAILSKPTAAGFVPVYFMFDLLLARKNAAIRARWISSAVLLAAMLALIVVLAKINYDKTAHAYVAPAGGSHFAAALTDIPILNQYIFNSIAPVALSIFYYNRIVTSPLDGFFLLHSLLLAALFLGTFKLSENRPRTLFLWGWFIGALGPALNIIPLPYLMQDRYAYMALPAILALFAECVQRLYARLVKVQSPGMPRLAALGGALLLAGGAFFRSDVYRNDFELFKDAVEKQPQSAYARQFFGLTLAETADKLELAGEGGGGSEKGEATLGTLRREALKQLEECVKCPDSDRLLEPGRLHILIGVLRERLGDPAAALPVLIAELKKPQKPYSQVIAYLSLARIKLQAGDAKLALKFVELAIASSSAHEASPEMLFQKGLCLEKLGRGAEAQDIYRKIPANTFAHRRALQRLKLLEN